MQTRGSTRRRRTSAGATPRPTANRIDGRRQYGKDDWTRMRGEQEAIEAEFAACLATGEQPDGQRAKAAAEQHRRHIDTWFYPCSHEMQVGLAEMYVADPRFAAHYDDRRPGLATYVHDAILANALDHIA